MTAKFSCTDPQWLALRAEGYARLGGACKACGSTTELEFDHVDPATKVFRLSSWQRRKRETWLAELAKCQLLCRPCHERKSILEAGKAIAKGTHGTLSAYRYCRCDQCCAAKSTWQSAYAARRRSASASAQGS